MAYPDLPVFDDHMHLDPRGDQEEAIKAFLRAGGSHLLLVHKPYQRPPPRTAEGHREAFDTTVALAERARSVGATVWLALAPHPAELTMLMDAGLSLDEAAAAYEAGLDVAAELAGSREDVVALGEVGRPHWDAPDDVMSVANGLFDAALQRCADVGCAAVLHTEPGTTETFAEWGERADRAGLDRHRVVKHFAGPIVGDAAHGVTPSLIANADNIREALAQTSAFMIETDYMDDPDRPGAVMGPKTVPKRTRSLWDEGVLDEDAWADIHVETPRRVYGIDISV